MMPSIQLESDHTAYVNDRFKEVIQTQCIDENSFIGRDVVTDLMKEDFQSGAQPTP